VSEILGRHGSASGIAKAYKVYNVT
jgi:hypothetical protein